MGLGRFLERELGSDHGTHGATFPQAQDVPGRPLHEPRVATEEAAEAHRLVEERRSTGKVVLVP